MFFKGFNERQGDFPVIRLFFEAPAWYNILQEKKYLKEEIMKTKRIALYLTLVTLLAAGKIAYAADTGDTHQDPVREKVVLNLNTGSSVTADDIQKMFTALTISYLQNNTSYIFGYEIYRDRNRQRLPSSLLVRELEYENFSITSIRYSFSNGYFEFKLSQTPFTNIINEEIVSSVDYDKNIDRALFTRINNQLQEAVYISRGYATMYRIRSTVSFYWFR